MTRGQKNQGQQGQMGAQAERNGQGATTSGACGATWGRAVLERFHAYKSLVRAVTWAGIKGPA